MENQTKEQAIEMVKNSFPTIFAKEDVIALINSIKVNEVILKGTTTAIDLNNDKLVVALKRLINSGIENLDNSDIVEEDNITLSLDSYNKQIEIEINDVNRGSICDAIEYAIDEFVRDFGNGERSMSDYLDNN